MKLVGQSPGVAYGELGPTHHSIEDFAWLRLLPNIAILSPADPWETAEAVKAAAAHEGPVFLRVSRYGVPQLPRAKGANFAIGKAETLREGRDVAIIANGVMVARALEAAAGIGCGRRQRARRQHGLDRAARCRGDRPPRETGAIVTIEEHSVRGGLGGAVAEVVAAGSAVPDAHARLPRLHAHRLGRFPVREMQSDCGRRRTRGARGDGDAARFMTGYVLALDQGTTNTKAVALDAEARVAARHSAPTPVRYPRPGWVEQSGAEIWRATCEAIEGCLAALPPGATIAAPLGVANQRETVLLWRRSTGEPIGPCVTWQCRRSADRIDRIRNPKTEEAVARTTGLALDPLFPAAKIGWLFDALPDARALARAGDVCAGTIDSWLLFNLTGGREHVTDAGNASRTQLLDIHAQAWSAELCELFDAPLSALPRVVDSRRQVSPTVAVGPLAAGAPVRAIMGDSHAALFGHGVREPGAVKATYGTGSSLMTLTHGARRSGAGLSTTIAWRRSGEVAYALEGNISVSAQAAAWIAELLGLADVEALSALAASASGDDSVTLVPAFAGLEQYENGTSRRTGPASAAITLSLRKAATCSIWSRGSRCKIIAGTPSRMLACS